MIIEDSKEMDLKDLTKIVKVPKTDKTVINI